MTVSRVVSQVSAPAPGMLHLVFHPTSAVITNTPDGHGRTYDFPRRVAVLDVRGGLPARVDLDALVSQPFEEQPQTWPAHRTADRVDLSGVAATSWTLRHLGQDEIDYAVRAVRAQYEALDAPHVIHTRSDDRWHRVRSEYSDLAVRVEGAWPLTEVVADFTFHTQFTRPLRRRTRVFDDAGLPIANPYLAIRLNEDLAEAEADLAELPVSEGRREI